MSSTTGGAIVAVKSGRFTRLNGFQSSSPFAKEAKGLNPDGENAHPYPTQYQKISVEESDFSSVKKSNPYIGYFTWKRKGIPNELALDWDKQGKVTNYFTANEKDFSSKNESSSIIFSKTEKWSYLSSKDELTSHTTNFVQDETCDSPKTLSNTSIAEFDGKSQSKQYSGVSRYSSEFDEIKKLGNGGQGVVFKVRSKIDGQYYAVKKIELPHGNLTQCSNYLREVRAMAKLPPHVNVVRYHTSWIEEIKVEATAIDSLSCGHSEISCQDSKQFDPSSESVFESYEMKPDDAIKSSQWRLFIQMELCEEMLHTVNSLRDTDNLTDWLKKHSENDMVSDAEHKESIELFRQVVEGVQHIHTNGVIHRDLKPDNIFLINKTPKIGDFGLSKMIRVDKSNSIHRDCANISESQHTTALGTFLYASPEQLGSSESPGNSAEYSEKSDIYALGIILLEICCLFRTMMERAQVLSAARHGLLPQEVLTKYPREMSLILKMTSDNPDERPNASMVLDRLNFCHSGEYDEALSRIKQPLVSDMWDIQQRISRVIQQLREPSQSALQLQQLVQELAAKIGLLGLPTNNLSDY